ncbi:pilus assembly PilX family protein [Tepidimonas sp.]|uniref:pilus assembly PilX family protein n=1 Tax=Tepidimonas sp. TaxID=2002775 RepID=UPI002FE1344B
MMTRHRCLPRSGRRASAGFTLVIALILLLAMTIIGVTTIRSTVIEQRLANATLDRNLAFQAAEAALRVGESVATIHARTAPALSQLAADGTCDRTVQSNCADGMCQLHDPDCPLRSSDLTVTAWATASTVNLGPLMGQHPQYLVEFLGANFDCAPPDPTSPNDPDNNCKRYRITARAQPANNDRATVMLEVLFATE